MNDGGRFGLDTLPWAVRGDDGRYRLPFGDQYLPVLYSLVAGESPGSQPGA